MIALQIDDVMQVEPELAVIALRGLRMEERRIYRALPITYSFCGPYGG